MMLSSAFVFLFCAAICTVNAASIGDIDGAGITMVRKTIISSELPNNKTMVLVTIQQKTVEMQVLPSLTDETEEKSVENTINQDSVGPNMLFGWQDLTRYNDADEEQGQNVSASAM